MSRRPDALPFPCLSVRFQVRGVAFDEIAVLDTGFEGGIAVPQAILKDVGLPVGRVRLELVGGNQISVPFYYGSWQIGDLGPFPVRIDVVGDEVLIGQRAIAYLTVTLDHGRRVIVSP